MNDPSKEPLFSESIKAGRRIYYFDVRQNRNGDKYIAITESKKVSDDNAENPHFTFEKHKLFLYGEDFDKFTNALQKTIAFAQGKEVVDTIEPYANSDDFSEEEENDHENLPDSSLKIDLDF